MFLLQTLNLIFILLHIQNTSIPSRSIGHICKCEQILRGTWQFIISLILVPLHFHHSILCVPSLCIPGVAWGCGDRSCPHPKFKTRLTEKNSLDNYCINLNFSCPPSTLKNLHHPCSIIMCLNCSWIVNTTDIMNAERKIWREKKKKLLA